MLKARWAQRQGLRRHSLSSATNVISEIRKIAAGRADPAFARWAQELDGAAAFVSVITLHELEHGVLLAERRDPDGAAP